MNTRTGPLIFVLLLVLLGLFLAPLAVMSQEAIPLPPDLAADLARPLVVQVVESHPWVATLLLLMGGLRLVCKPVMSLVRARVAATPSTDDDAQLQRVMSSWWYQSIAWSLDFLASIKIPPPASRSTGISAASVERGAASLLALGFAFITATVVTGCASFTTTQTEDRNEAEGTTSIRTRVAGRTLFTSKSQLTSFSAVQTEGKQGASVGSLTQQSSGTNAVKALEALDSILGKIR